MKPECRASGQSDPYWTALVKPIMGSDMNAVVAETKATGLVSMIERLAERPDVDVAKLEKLLELQERILAKQAESEFHAAMTRAQSEMGPISADAMNPQTRSKYATYAKLDRVLRPIYTKHGFAISFDEGDSPKPEHVRVLGYVSHIGGHCRTYRRDMPADGKGAKGGDVMTKTHAAGAAGSYGARYILKGVFNVAIGEEDRDGNAPHGKTLSEDQVANLEALLTEVGANKASFLRWAKVQSLGDILDANYGACVKAIEAKRKQP